MLGAVLPLFPLDETDLVAATSRESRRWQYTSLIGGLFAVLGASILSAALAGATSPGIRLLAASALPFLGASPFFWRVAFTSLLSPPLFYAAFRLALG